MGKSNCVLLQKPEQLVWNFFCYVLVVYLRDHNQLTSSITNITEAIVRTVELNRSSKYCGKYDKGIVLD